MRRDDEELATGLHHARNVAQEPGQVVDVLEEVEAPYGVDARLGKGCEHLEHVADEVHARQVERVDADRVRVALGRPATEFELDAAALGEPLQHAVAIEDPGCGRGVHGGPGRSARPDPERPASGATL